MLCLAGSLVAQPPTALWLRGYSAVPAPQRVSLDDREITLDDSWKVDARGPGAGHIACRTLLRDAAEFHRLALEAGDGPKLIRLQVRPGTVATGAEAAVDRQAYRLRIRENVIEVTGNSDQGLFYGVQTLLQLIRRDSDGRLRLPCGTIEDWPRLPLRFLHWDTKHHQDRMETLKRYLDWSARLKVNMIAFELEDKFEYPSHPVIGAPGAFTTAQLQELVSYGLERFIQIVPDVQAPAHMAYVLKHPEFAHLRADGNNYQSALCRPATYDLIFSMYDDVVKATRGVDYFFVSTDEVYYAGIESDCPRPYNPVNRSLTWVEFVRKARDFLASRGRRILVWAEYPLLPEHVSLLPPDI
ncbi:MAG: beta-N-acetylhexosaminidase, partial [Bryobacteraceae bacterium]